MKRLFLLCVFFLSWMVSAADLDPELTMKRANCTVRVWLAHDVQGGRCYFSDEVMVGIKSLDPLVVRCGRVEVQCPKGNVDTSEE